MGKLNQFDYMGYSISANTYKTKNALEVFEDGVLYWLRYGDEWLEIKDGHIFWLGNQTYEDYGIATEDNLKKTLNDVREVEEYILSFMDNEQKL